MIELARLGFSDISPFMNVDAFLMCWSGSLSGYLFGYLPACLSIYLSIFLFRGREAMAGSGGGRFSG